MPSVYDTALRHPDSLLHLEHLCYVLAGCLLWWPVIQSAPHQLSTGGRAVYVFAAFVLASPLGLLLTLLPSPVYAFYEHAPRLGALAARRPADRGRDDGGRAVGCLLRRVSRFSSSAFWPRRSTAAFEG